MKIRIYNPLFPYPPDEGNMLTVFDQACSLAKNHEVELVSWMDSEEEVLGRRERGSPIEVPSSLRLRPLVGPDGQGGGESAWRRIYRSFADDTASTESHFYPEWPLRLIRNDAPVDLEIFHHMFAFPWLVKKSRNSSRRRVCMVHDISSRLYRHRALGARNPLARWYHNHGADILERHEKGLGDLVDDLWFVSPMEMEWFRQRYKIPCGRITSPTFDVKHAQRIRDTFVHSRHAEGPALFGVLGTLHHPPNLWSAQFVIEKVAPLLAREKFTGIIQIVGKNARDKLMEAASRYPFIRVSGFVPDLAQFWNGLSGMLVPHVGGTGVRMKLLEALAYGVPVLANTEAVSRLHQDLQASPLLSIRDEPSEWCRFLLEERPLARRYELSHLGMSKALQGKEVYSFVGEAYLNQK